MRRSACGLAAIAALSAVAAGITGTISASAAIAIAEYRENVAVYGQFDIGAGKIEPGIPADTITAIAAIAIYSVCNPAGSAGSDSANRQVT